MRWNLRCLQERNLAQVHLHQRPTRGLDKISGLLSDDGQTGRSLLATDPEILHNS
jgi:hypothetical protein